MVVSDDFSAELGKANNLNAVHFSTNLGIGFKYRFWNLFKQILNQPLSIKSTPLAVMMVGLNPTLLDCIPV